MTQILDALVVGAGAIGSGYDAATRGRPALTHAGAYTQHPGSRLMAGVDPDPHAAARFEAAWEAPCFSDLEGALSAGVPSVASICTPASGRQAVVNRLLEAGVGAIWCEKPLAADLAGGEAIVEACDRAGAALQVNFLRRFDPLHQNVARRVEELGGPLHVDVRYSGSLASYGTHGVDLFRWLAGEVAWVDALALDRREPVVVLGTAEGATATLVQVPGPSAELFEVDVLAAGERLTLSGLGEQLLIAQATPSSLFEGVVGLRYGEPEDAEGLAPAMIGGVQALIDHRESRVPLPCSGADGLAALAVTGAIEAALAGRGRVAVGARA